MVGDQQQVLPFEQVEEHLTKRIVELYIAHQPRHLFVVNGPASFTNLRVGALVANLLVRLAQGNLQLMNLGKIDLFRYLYQQ